MQSKILRRAEVLEIVGVSNPTLWRWIRDGNFPSQIIMSPGRVGWIASEVQAWIESRPRFHTDDKAA